MSATAPTDPGPALPAVLCAVAPVELGGAILKGPPGPVRDTWLDLLRGLLPPDTPWRRVPAHISDDRLLGGLDLAATLSSGRRVAERGVLADADGGLVVLPMAERLPVATVAKLCAVIDDRAVCVERDGLTSRHASRFGVIACDEGIGPDETVDARLQDRLAFHITMDRLGPADVETVFDRNDVSRARRALNGVDVPDDVLQSLCTVALKLNVASLRAVMLALGAARAHAALAGRDTVADSDAGIAARLVLAPRVIVPPDVERDEAEAEPERAPPEDEPPPDDADRADQPSGPLDETVLAAVRAALPPGLLDLLANQSRRRERRRGRSGRSGALQKARRRGRPVGIVAGLPVDGKRLNVLATLKAAAPFQRLRGADRPGSAAGRLDIRRDDLRVTRYKHKAGTTTIFVVDASGSAAMHRLAETKGAVEMLLADCYVRRDEVAMIAFRGKGAETVLPPTRSLVRAKRHLAALPGGGGTPLASGIEAAAALAEAERHKGQTPVVVVMTDGRANIGRAGEQGGDEPARHAGEAARMLRELGIDTLLIDIARRPGERARALAADMGAQYLPLPHADAATVSSAVRAATAS